MYFTLVRGFTEWECRPVKNNFCSITLSVSKQITKKKNNILHL
ncbi:GSCOCG00005403001-RA-CDS [Cotesia congregata]|nr:GSCOCG00005403001-RA-CDS [Cotesia congregata]